jgi:hypothetical protein
MQGHQGLGGQMISEKNKVGHIWAAGYERKVS